MDGNGTLFGTVAGNTREIVHKFTVDLPKKHGRGGQSALRFARLRDEKRHNYVRKVAELAVQHFIAGDKVNVTGLVLAGSADFKTELSQSDMFDQRLVAKIIKVVDVSYGGENGFNQVSCRRLVRLTVIVTEFWVSSGYRACCGVFGQCQIRAGEEIDSEVLRRDQPGQWSLLFRYRGYSQGSRAWCCRDSHRLGELGHHALYSPQWCWRYVPVSMSLVRSANKMFRGGYHLRQQGARKGPREVHGQVHRRRDGASRRASVSPRVVR